jgi:hypothetical protein
MVEITTAYCATCRTEYYTDKNPPYSVMHLSQGSHVHPITREPYIDAEYIQ